MLRLALAAGLLLGGCGGGDAPDAAVPDVVPEAALEAAPEPPRPSPTALDSTDLLRENRAADSVIAMERIAWARQQRLDTLPTGALMAAIGRTFVGTPYVPQTLELEGQERLILNLRALDCVTFVENVLALARTVQAGGGFSDFTRELQRIRYRTGVIEGYPSRLHYFSEWISANAQKGLVEDVTQQLGGELDREPLNFMSSNRQAYRQLADEEAFRGIRIVERRLAEQPRYWIPKAEITALADGIRDGDIIAATSSLPGLDVAHTGLAIWVDGQLHLMHAPLVGDSVEISDRPLAERIQRIARQDGIMVARPR